MNQFVQKISAGLAGVAAAMFLLSGTAVADTGNFHIPPDAPINTIDPDSDVDTIPNRFAPDPLLRSILTTEKVQALAPYNFQVREVEDDFRFVTRGLNKGSKNFPHEAFVGQHFVVTPPAEAEEGRVRYDYWIYYRYLKDKYVKHLKNIFDESIRDHPPLPSSFIDDLTREQIEFRYEKISNTKSLKAEKRHSEVDLWTDPENNFVEEQPDPYLKYKRTYTGWKRHPNLTRGSFYNIPQMVTMSGRQMGLLKVDGGAYLITIDFQMSNPWDPFAFNDNLMTEISNWLKEKDQKQRLYHFDYHEPVRPIGP